MLARGQDKTDERLANLVGESFVRDRESKQFKRGFERAPISQNVAVWPFSPS